jgi:oligoribonuclease
MIVWCDVETTGLSPEKDHLLEVALVVTDDDLVEQCHTSVVMQPVGISIGSVQMDKKVVDMHTKNGLLDEVRALEQSDIRGMRLHQAEQQLLNFLSGAFTTVAPVASEKCAHCGRGEKEHEEKVHPLSEMQLMAKLCPADGYFSCSFQAKYVPAVSQTPLAGSTIAFDRSFLRAHMPRLHEKFHYRSVDVSSLTEIAKRWAPEVYEARPKNPAGAPHRALADARESIEYLRFFKSVGFVSTNIRAFSTCSNCGVVSVNDGKHHCEITA